MKLNRLVVLVLVVCIPGLAVAQDLFPQAASASELRRADGLIWDASLTDPWVFDGEFVLICRGAPSCSAASLANVDFDLALTMVRPDGDGSHSHTFSNFVATSVTVDQDDLLIEGDIDFSGQSIPITVSIVEVAGRATFFFELVGNAHIIGPIGGVVVRSR